MEQFVLGIFQEHLSKFIVGFRKEQVNANLLNGKGEITDVHMNCAVLNELLAKMTPFVQLESVHVSKLSFHVTSWANLKKAPIVVDIEDVTATIVEPLGFLDRSQRRVARQISQQELNELIQQGLHKLRGAYNLFDRIADNIHVEMRAFSVTFQPRGKFKTCRIGVWTPPTLLVELRHIKYVSVDEYGQEGTPEQVWNHNRHAPGQSAQLRTFMIYKKLSLQCTVGLRDAVTGDDLPRLIRDAQVEVHLAFRKRLRDAAVLAAQVDVTARKVEVHVPTESVASLAHAAAGIQYCVSKDRAFEDPLVSEANERTDEVNVGEAVVVTTEEEEDDKHVDEEEGDDGEDDEEEDQEMLPADVSVSDSDDYASVGDDTSVDDASTRLDASARQSSFVSARSQSGYLSRPLILLPNGLVIYERLSVSFSVHQCTVRGIYNMKDDGYVQLVTKGLVVEAMWPKDSGPKDSWSKGGYVQASLSFVSLQEKYGKRVRSILLGGVQHDIDKLPIGLPGKPRPEKGADSSFPLFEDRSVRPDPFGLRHTFPEQAFGIKMTIGFIEKVSNPEEEDIMVLHEIGVDQFDVLVDTDAWNRAIRFATNEDGNGFDGRWHTGDWGDELLPSMLVNPTSTLDLTEHLQPKKELFLDENLMISSDLMNVTARIVNVEVRIPAAIQNDVRSCDVIVAFSETMLVVSSALPRTFLTGKIGASIRGEGAEGGGEILFPNDPSDLCYSLEASEDPSIRQLGTMAAKGISTARCQLTIRGFSVHVVPVIPFCDAKEAQQLLEPTEMTMIVCFEGEAESPESNLIKVVLFVSLQFHRLAINWDFDVLTGALSTILYHYDVLQETISVVEELRFSLRATNVDRKSEGVSSRMSKTLKNRRVLVRRQIEKSREAGGLSISACMQLAEFSFTVWRQNVPLTSRFRASLSNDRTAKVDDTNIALMKLLLFEMNGLEVGAEIYVHQLVDRRVVLKGCLPKLRMQICDFERECEKCLTRNANQRDDDDVGESQIAVDANVHAMIELLAFGLHTHEHRSYAEVAWGHNDILLRAEDHLDSTRSMSLAVEIGPPGVVYLRVRELESLCLLLAEALLMPTGLRTDRFKVNANRRGTIVFPNHSVGELFSWFIHSAQKKPESEVEVVTCTSETSEVDDVVHASVLKLLPERTNKVMAQVLVVDVLVFVPDKAVARETTDEARWLGLVVHQTRLLAGYFSPESTRDQHAIMTTFASGGEDWSTLFVSQETGIHLLVRARPSLYNGVRKNSICVTTECLVSEFEITCSYHPSDFALSMGDTTLSVKNLDDLNHLQKYLLAVKDQGIQSLNKLNAVVAALRREEPPTSRETSHDNFDDEASRAERVPTTLEQPFDPSSEIERSLQGLRRSLNRLRQVSEAHSLQLKDVLERQKQKIGSLRFEVFSRERDRIAALALISSQATGWLKMGGTHVYGQRLSGVTTMWRYFVVLHKSLLILYSSPGQPKPMDIVFLDGARLLPMAGRRKRDVKRGFAIVESGGVARFFMAESGPEFERWILDIGRVTRGRDGESSTVALDEPLNSEMGAELRESGDLNASPSREVATDIVDDDNTPKRAQIRQRLSAVTSTTKSKLGSAAAGAKTRLGPAAAGTKNRIGSAVQAARHRNASNDGPISQPGTQSTRSLSSEDGSFSSEDHTWDPSNASPGPDRKGRMGGRFAAVKAGTKNRFGSALQAAKEKGKAAAEQRRRRIHERGEHSTSQIHDASSESLTAGVEPQSILAENPTQLTSRAVPLGDFDETTVGAATPPRDGQPSISNLQQNEEPILEGVESETEELVDQSLSAESDVSMAENPMAPPGQGRRALTSKLGAAVQSVRRSAARGSAREEADDTMFFDPSNALKLRGIHIGHGDPVQLTGKDISNADVQLKTMKGYWISSVESCTVETDADSPAEEHVANESFSTSTAAVAVPQEVSDDSKSPPSSMEELGDAHVQSMLSDQQKRLESVYKIRVASAKNGRPSPEAHVAEGDGNEITRSLSDLLSLQTALSECVSRVIVVARVGLPGAESESDKEVKLDTPSEEDINSLDLVRLAGRLLRGLVETGSDEFDHADEFHEYQCELVKEFLNLTLDTPLPRDGVEAISRFLECPYLTTGASSHQHESISNIDSEVMDVFGPAIEPPIASSQEILACAVACENDLLRLETQGDLTLHPVVEARKTPESPTRETRQFIPQVPATVSPSPAPFLGPLLPFEITESLHGALHGALMKIMTERDESHAQLIAASVLHVHEIEQERKRVDRLTQQLKETQVLVKAAQMQNVAGNFFADRKLPEPNRESAKSKLSAIQEQVIQNSEQEMLMLCQQLASEISAKTSASLEIIRLKESRKIEQETEQAEKMALQNELKRCKELLALQEQKTNEAMQAANVWKEAFEKSNESNVDTAHTAS